MAPSLITHHTITLDTDNRKNTVIRKSALPIVTQPLQTHQKQTLPPKNTDKNGSM